MELPYVEECGSCTHLMVGEEEARKAENRERESDYRVLARRHLRIVHDVTVKASQ